MFNNNKCYNGGNKHNFEARYDEVPRKGQMSGESIAAYDLRALLYYKVYIKDICTWCGKVMGKGECSVLEKD